MSSTWGEKLKISIFGESHSVGIGVVIDGLPAGEGLCMEELRLQMARRAPGQDKSATPRKEGDLPQVLSGLVGGKLTGTPLCAIISNTNVRSQDYANLLQLPRPGHGDYTGFLRYNGAGDVRGGGHFSGRLTAPLVFAGAVARQILERRGIVIGAHALSIGGIKDSGLDPIAVQADQLKKLSSEYFPVIFSQAKQQMQAAIEEARMGQNSLGGIVECAAIGMPAGIGDPMFGGVENRLASILFGIPAVKAVEFGVGFGVADMQGSENNDEFYYDEQGNVKTRTNNCGGILGGITTGMPIVFRMAVKPTASISLMQHTVNLETGKNDRLVVNGRHDPCIVPRAVPVAEAATAIALLDLMEAGGKL